MSVTQLNNQPTQEDIEENTRAYWVNRASLLGVEFPKNITLDKLKEMVLNKQAEQSPVAGTRGVRALERLHPSVARMHAEATQLVRFKIKVVDPSKQDWTGMLVTVGNDNLAPVKRAIYFIDEPWHAEKIIVEYLKSAKYVHRPTKYNKQFKGSFNNHSAPKFLNAFIIEELPPLTEEELKELAKAQATNNTGQQQQD